MTDHALRLPRHHDHLAEPAAFPFGFDLRRADRGEPVRPASGGPLRAVAGDDTGGTYFVCADGSVLYADSEGSAGIIGSETGHLTTATGSLDTLRSTPTDPGGDSLRHWRSVNLGRSVAEEHYALTRAGRREPPGGGRGDPGRRRRDTRRALRRRRDGRTGARRGRGGAGPGPQGPRLTGRQANGSAGIRSGTKPCERRAR